MTVPRAWVVKTSSPGLNPALLMIREYVGEIEVTLPAVRRETTPRQIPSRVLAAGCSISAN